MSVNDDYLAYFTFLASQRAVKQEPANESPAPMALTIVEEPTQRSAGYNPYDHTEVKS